MKVRPNTVVRMEYVLRVDGREADSSPEGESVTILHGHDYLLPPGLEERLLGLSPGPFRIQIPAGEIAGRHDPGKVMAVDRDEFPPDAVLEEGEEFYAEDEDGTPVIARVVDVEGKTVTVDTNPEYAGKTLEYEGVIHHVREAEPEEVDHGHVHGEGGVSH